MLALQIPEIRDFTSKLLIGTTFDAFWLREADITTFATYTIDGSLHKGFFDSDEADELEKNGQTYARWQDLKPFCFSVMKGKKTPLFFKIIFQLSRKNLEKLLFQSGLNLRSEDVTGLYLNFQYDGKRLTCTTGSSLNIFTLDKSLDRYWDEMVLKFFKQQQILVETL